jgi:hypothetical protein
MRNSLFSFNQNKNPKPSEFAHSGRMPVSPVLNVPDVRLRSGARPSSRTALNPESFDGEPINVLFSFDGRDQYARPVRLTWNDEDYFLGGVQFWYAEHKGAVLVHHYRVSDEHGEFTFELSLETENLTWNLDKASKASAKTFSGRSFIGATL